MKFITTFIAIIALHTTAFCQPAAASEEAETAPATVINSIVYSEDSEALEYSMNAPVKSREITIASLPPATQTLTAINLEFGMTGSFTFKKDPALEVHDNLDVYIEDMLTGRVFDLKTSDSYSFSVNRKFPNRFVLHIDKMLLKYAMSSNGK